MCIYKKIVNDISLKIIKSILWRKNKNQKRRNRKRDNKEDLKQVESVKSRSISTT